MTRTYIFAAGLAVILAGVWLLLSPKPSVQSLPDPWETASTTQELVTEARTVPDGMLEYRSNTYHFSLLYPQELSVDERSEGGGAMTITFEDREEGKGLQIFIVPYKESQISEERFRRDEPSGVRESLENIVIDGASGAAFYSRNASLGETREVWFIRGGYLYEVTTLKLLEEELLPILQSWQFI